MQLRDREELQLRESQQWERECSAAKSSKKSTQEEVPDDSDQGGQDDGEGDGDGEEHNEGDGNGEEHECHDDGEDVDGKDQDEVWRTFWLKTEHSLTFTLPVSSHVL